MTYMPTGVVYISRMTRPQPKPRVMIADGIRRMAEAGDIEPGHRFVSESEYQAMTLAYDIAMDEAVKLAYAQGRKDELRLILTLLLTIGAVTAIAKIFL
jgi:hypothetical protein